MDPRPSVDEQRNGNAERRCGEKVPGDANPARRDGPRRPRERGLEKNEPENRKTGKVHPTAHGVPETLTTELVVKKTREIELAGQSQAQDQVLTSATRLYVSIHAT